MDGQGDASAEDALQAEEFFVPATFWGAGIGRSFLPKLAVELKKNCREALVLLPDPPIRDESRRKEQADLIQMYRQAGFTLQRRVKDEPLTMRRTL